MSFNFYHLIRLSLSLCTLFVFSSYYPVFGQLVELADSSSEIVLGEGPTYSLEQEAFIGYTARGQTLASEGFEAFTLYSDRKENVILEYTVSGRWGYIHIRADEEISLRKVKKAIAKASRFFDDIEGIILDIRYNTTEEANQNEWVRYVYQELFTGPVLLLSSTSFVIPDNWEHYFPWQFSPNEANGIVTTELKISGPTPKTTSVKDAVILSALRKLRIPSPFKEFDSIW